jgi:hypothetical protein
MLDDQEEAFVGYLHPCHGLELSCVGVDLVPSAHTGNRLHGTVCEPEFSKKKVILPHSIRSVQNSWSEALADLVNIQKTTVPCLISFLCHVLLIWARTEVVDLIWVGGSLQLAAGDRLQSRRVANVSSVTPVRGM